MSSRKKEEVFQLVKSLEKGEKRNFKLFVKRNSANSDLKIIQLFDILDKMNVYNEGILLKQNKNLKKQQLSNLKAHLYKQILASLRVMSDSDDIENMLHEEIKNARILYRKGLYLQSLRILQRTKQIALAYHQGTFLLQILIFEKKIESLHITRSLDNRAEELSEKIAYHTQQLKNISAISNFALQLYGKYISNGHARNPEEVRVFKDFFFSHIPADSHLEKSFYGRLYLFQAHVWYGFILQDVLQYYRYAQKWVSLFEEESQMVPLEINYLLKGYHHLLQALFMLRHADKFRMGIERFQVFLEKNGRRFNENGSIQAFIYLELAHIDLHFLEGTFTKGWEIIPRIEVKMAQFQQRMDDHYRLTFYYKIACLYFGGGDNEKAIQYLSKIIHSKWHLREDLQCYARLLHLIAHFELGHFDIMDSLIKSVYRFMAKMQNLSAVEEEIFGFLRQSLHLYPQDLNQAFEDLLHKLQQLENIPGERRAFMYLDFISWLQSKLQDVPVEDIIRKRYLQRLGEGE
ncbi:MAG: hypothetical protein AAFW00_07110 [Bacteroidota bacterium]